MLAHKKAHSLAVLLPIGPDLEKRYVYLRIKELISNMSIKKLITK